MPYEQMKARDYLVVISARIVGSISLIAWMAFIFLGSPGHISLDLNEPVVYGFDALLCLAFFIQHSVMTRCVFRKWMTRYFPEAYTGAAYTICSGVVLMIQMVLWQKSISNILIFQGVASGIIRSVFFLSFIGFVSGVRALNSFDAFGVDSILRRLRGEAPQLTDSFTTAGPYRWMRHPLYFFCLLFIWCCPVLSGDRLLFDLLWTCWIIFAAMLEERDLVSAFGEAYREYQMRVPMLIPWKIPKAESTQFPADRVE